MKKTSHLFLFIPVLFLTTNIVIKSTKLVFAETFTYLIDMRELPNSVDKIDLPKNAKQAGYENIMEKGIKENETRLPHQVTRSVMPANTNYALVVVTPKLNSEKTWFEFLESKGIAKKLSSFDLPNIYDSRVGGWIQTPVPVKFNDLPDDFNLQRSSP